MPLPKAIGRFNRQVTNPLARHIAGWAPGFCILRHVGRHSSRVYHTPLNVFEVAGGFVFALTYGPDTDWVKNVVAAGGCTIRHERIDYALVRPRFLPVEQGMASVPAMVRLILRLVGVTDFLRMERSDG
ncbi:MAG TPA: nitroreductase family deazaflavin-dependent oxidoreductase [Acidimicrobiia bacterium]|nr:nitroreductase family deazaflavin-dependent oxidoreductase [Acidimicrobiia bacterium]